MDNRDPPATIVRKNSTVKLITRLLSVLCAKHITAMEDLARLAFKGTASFSNPCYPCRRPGGSVEASFFGCSVIVASVVTINPAIEAASWRAVRTTLAGSIMPRVTRSAVFAGLRIIAVAIFLGFEQLADHPSPLTDIHLHET